ncbi:MAG: VCBS repeat-containing protein [Planctomycetes bacterium]|nr:VCBS repeat-containing protein [Planctomycetota bacterium]
MVVRSVSVALAFGGLLGASVLCAQEVTPAAVLETAAKPTSELVAPIMLQAGGKPIEVDIGHAAPLHYDFDGDGVRDLLVGQFGGGKLNIYRNTGTESSPIFAAGVFLQAGGADASVPAS